ncbi:MAG: hypothetical protein HRU20_13385 [Pseudomonadales bacterium]|nr:hypothetical protein [Pseudomonadales bacterium]
MTKIIKTCPKILWLKDITTQPVGGKALGLNKLMGWGLNVPNGFVIIDAQPGQIPSELAEFYQQLGAAKVAVRSSALGEDGEESSFAGLYESILNVEGLDAFQPPSMTVCNHYKASELRPINSSNR